MYSQNCIDLVVKLNGRISIVSDASSCILHPQPLGFWAVSPFLFSLLIDTLLHRPFRDRLIYTCWYQNIALHLFFLLTLWGVGINRFITHSLIHSVIPLLYARYKENLGKWDPPSEECAMSFWGQLRVFPAALKHAFLCLQPGHPSRLQDRCPSWNITANHSPTGKRKTITDKPSSTFSSGSLKQRSCKISLAQVPGAMGCHRTPAHPLVTRLPTSWPAGSFVQQGVTSRCEEYKVLVTEPFIHLCPWAGVFLLSLK